MCPPEVGPVAVSVIRLALTFCHAARPALQVRMYAATASVSAFMNNTPLVAVMIPVVERWCRDNRLPVSKFMIPLRCGGR